MITFIFKVKSKTKFERKQCTLHSLDYYAAVNIYKKKSNFKGFILLHSKQLPFLYATFLAPR